MAQVDVEAVHRNGVEEQREARLAQMIVDLMKLLGLDSSFSAQGLKELGYTGDPNDSASMNMAAQAGDEEARRKRRKVPADLNRTEAAAVVRAAAARQRALLTREVPRSAPGRRRQAAPKSLCGLWARVFRVAISMARITAGVSRACAGSSARRCHDFCRRIRRAARHLIAAVRHRDKMSTPGAATAM